jgi:hypothetical protein
MYRRNAADRIDALIALARQLDEPRLADLMEKYRTDPDIANALVQVATLAAQVVPQYMGVRMQTEVQTPTLTDADAWRMLAQLVPSALADAPEDYKKALIAAFKREGKAA